MDNRDRDDLEKYISQFSSSAEEISEISSPEERDWLVTPSSPPSVSQLSGLGNNEGLSSEFHSREADVCTMESESEICRVFLCLRISSTGRRTACSW